MSIKKIAKQYERLIAKVLKAENKKQAPNVMICNDMVRIYNILLTSRRREKARSVEKRAGSVLNDFPFTDI